MTNKHNPAKKKIRLDLLKYQKNKNKTAPKSAAIKTIGKLRPELAASTPKMKNPAA